MQTSKSIRTLILIVVFAIPLLGPDISKSGLLPNIFILVCYFCNNQNIENLGDVNLISSY